MKELDKKFHEILSFYSKKYGIHADYRDRIRFLGGKHISSAIKYKRIIDRNNNLVYESTFIEYAEGLARNIREIEISVKTNIIALEESHDLI